MTSNVFMVEIFYSVLYKSCILCYHINCYIKSSCIVLVLKTISKNKNKRHKSYTLKENIYTLSDNKHIDLSGSKCNEVITDSRKKPCKNKK